MHQENLSFRSTVMRKFPPTLNHLTFLFYVNQSNSITAKSVGAQSRLNLAIFRIKQLTCFNNRQSTSSTYWKYLFYFILSSTWLLFNNFSNFLLISIEMSRFFCLSLLLVFICVHIYVCVLEYNNNNKLLGTFDEDKYFI